MNNYPQIKKQDIEKLLSEWCEHLISHQAEDGGFLCDACGFEHGRSDNACYPFLWMYSVTNEERWIEAVRKLLSFRRKLSNPDGSVSNDFESPWKGITVFSAVCLYKCLHYFGNIIPHDLKKEIEDCFISSSEWVHNNIVSGFRANINYFCAAAAVNAMYGSMFENIEYTNRAEELFSYCLGLFTENGILCGEGQPHDSITLKGCVPADIGYIAEEAIPCLCDAAFILGHDIDTLAGYSDKLLDFMLPDGGWDNTFGSRNNKWTYYGSRTASGCAGTFMKLGSFNNRLNNAAMMNISQMSNCTFNGVLYGGPHYMKAGIKPCIHHTFSHAVGLTDAVLNYPDSVDKEQIDSTCHYKYYPELDTWKINFGNWMATVTGYDFSTYTWKKGASHCSGGMLSMLYNKKYGPYIMGSVTEYERTELNNMQKPDGCICHSSLIPRFEFEINGNKYSTSFCFESEIKVEDVNTGINVSVNTYPENIDHEKYGKCRCNFSYYFTEERLSIKVSSEHLPDNAAFVLPVMENVNVIGDYDSKRKIFFLDGGFIASEYIFRGKNIEVEINGKMKIDER